jgi:hypothetical protein
MMSETVLSRSTGTGQSASVLSTATCGGNLSVLKRQSTQFHGVGYQKLPLQSDGALCIQDSLGPENKGYRSVTWRTLRVLQKSTWSGRDLGLYFCQSTALFSQTGTPAGRISDETATVNSRSTDKPVVITDLGWVERG